MTADLPGGETGSYDRNYGLRERTEKRMTERGIPRGFDGGRMTATQLPKPGDRFRWTEGCGTRTVVAVTEHNVHYETKGGTGCAEGIQYWLDRAIPIPPKPHVETVQWGRLSPSGRVHVFSSERSTRSYINQWDGTLAKLDHGVLFVEADGEFVRAFEDGAE